MRTRTLPLLALAVLALTSCGLTIHRQDRQPVTLAVAASAIHALTFHQPVLQPLLFKGQERYQNARRWDFCRAGDVETVPKGLIVDGASVPRAAWFFMPPDGVHRAAALAHDWIYQNRGNLPTGHVLTRDQADLVFYNLMVQAGASEWRARVAYRGVRLGGWYAWDHSNGSPVIAPVSRMLMLSKSPKPRTLFSHIYAE